MTLHQTLGNSSVGRHIFQAPAIAPNSDYCARCGLPEGSAIHIYERAPR